MLFDHQKIDRNKDKKTNKKLIGKKEEKRGNRDRSKEKVKGGIKWKREKKKNWIKNENWRKEEVNRD